MTDEIIRELWEIKDSIAREHGYDIDARIAYLRAQSDAEHRETFDLSAKKRPPGPPLEGNKKGDA